MNSEKERGELLALAAKAAYTYAFLDHGQGMYTLGLHTGMKVWNPLNNNEDAFKLAVDLRFTILMDKKSVTVSSMENTINPIHTQFEMLGEDPYKVVRLAIVLTAASIGREKNEYYADFAKS